MTDEGVTKFTFDRKVASPAREPVVRELIEERRELYLRDSIGCNMKRYGACYGNASARVGAFGAPPGRREFIVSGTQTGGIPSPGPESWVRIMRYDHAGNRVWASGPCDPSSESLTHAAIYDADLSIRAVVHGHDRHTWLWLLEKGAPATAAHVGYGTQAMATAAAEIVRSRRTSPFNPDYSRESGMHAPKAARRAASERSEGYPPTRRTPGAPQEGESGVARGFGMRAPARREYSGFDWPGVFAMSGHEDGVVAWGDSVKEATQRFIAVYEAARLR